MKTYIINLPSSKDRRENVVKQFKDQKIDFEIINAIYGKDIPADELSELADMAELTRQSKYATLGAVGLCLTNKKLYQKIIDENLDYAIAFEDDVMIDSSLPSLLRDIEKHIMPGEIILLYYKKLHAMPHGTFSKHDVVKVNSTYSLYYPIDANQFDMGLAVVITRDAGAGIIRVNTPVKAGPDKWSYFYDNGGIKQMRCVYPPPVFPADFKSTFEYVEVKYGFINKVLSFIDKYKIFPFYQLLKIRRRNVRINTEKYMFSDQQSIFVK